MVFSIEAWKHPVWGLREQEVTLVQKEALRGENVKKQVEPVLATLMYFQMLSNIFFTRQTIWDDEPEH